MKTMPRQRFKPRVFGVFGKPRSIKSKILDAKAITPELYGQRVTDYAKVGALAGVDIGIQTWIELKYSIYRKGVINGVLIRYRI